MGDGKGHGDLSVLFFCVRPCDNLITYMLNGRAVPAACSLSERRGGGIKKKRFWIAERRFLCLQMTKSGKQGST